MTSGVSRRRALATILAGGLAASACDYFVPFLESGPAGPTPAPVPTSPLGSPGPLPPNQNGPWNRDLDVRTGDGGRFGPSDVFTPYAGVPCLAKDAAGRLVAVFQWFPLDRTAAFDRVAVRFSTDGGLSWSDPTAIVVNGSPPSMQRPFDPTIVLLEDGRLRLYFTSSQGGGQTAFFSAVSVDGVSYDFEPGVRFAVNGRMVVDCAVGSAGGRWNLVAPIGRPEDGAYHAVSDDGLRFERVADIPSVGGVNWTGNLIRWGEGLRFYGSSRNGVWWSFSTDGTTWTDPVLINVAGGDPAVVEVRPERVRLVVVSEPRRNVSPPGR
ncbi:MAG: sialidase family protein [Dehalococcoidia bacterium]